MNRRRQVLALLVAALAIGPFASAKDKKDDKSDKKLPKVFFDITIGGEEAGRIVMELRSDVVPKTAENFRACAPAKRASASKAPRFTV